MKNINPLYSVLILLMLFAFRANAQQIKITNLLSPNAVTLPGTVQDLIIEFKNNSAVTLTNFDFYWQLNGGPVVGPVAWVGPPLNAGDKTSVTLATFIMPSLLSNLAVWGINGVPLPGDTAYFLLVANGIQSLPYVEDFEGAINWSGSGTSFSSGFNQDSWQLAVPNYGSITPTIPGSKAWVMGLDSGYGNDISTYLYSPIFNFAASGINSIWIHFTTNANLALNDNVTVQYTTDFITWTALPSLSVTGNTSGWTGLGTGISFLATEPQVQFRFVFSSDNSGTADGIAIDDFELIQCVISMINMNMLTPVSCAGACDGVLEASPQIGNPPFTYLWAGSETTQSINVCAGNYTVTVTDANGCSGVAFQTVNQPQPIIFNLGPDATICNGSSPSLCGNATGGTPPYNYLWNTGAITPCITVTTSGSYSVTVTDVNGCSFNDAINLTVNSNPTPVITGISVVCNGTPTQFDAGAGYAGYLWSNGVTTQTNIVGIAGSYTVTVTDANGCTGSASNSLTYYPPTPPPTITGNPFSCFGANGMFDAGAGYTAYYWSTGETTQVIMPALPGTYTVTVADINWCTATASVNFGINPPIVVTPYEAFNCITLTDSVYIIPTGGIPPYIYNWSNGTTAFYLSNPLPGVYTVNVTDINGCTASGSITVIGSLNLSLTKVDPDCYGYPSAMSAAMNGVPPLTYLWSNGVTVPQLVNPPGGTYTVTVTDVSGCSLSATDSIVEPPPVVLTLDSVIPSGCGVSDGAFYYSFTPSAFSIPWINGVQFATSTNLPKGVYNIYIVQNVCASNTVTVVVPDSCADVWPGDANYDLVADNKDLLQIGLAYGNTGSVRPAASNTWVAQSCTDWSNWFNIGVNQKHADCDGNGIIDAADTIPVLLNYGSTHPLKPIVIPQVNTLAPDLYLVITQDTTGLSDSVFISVMCGTATDPVDSIYGLAFTLYYDSALVDTNSVYFDYSNSFLGTAGVNLISINKNFGVGYSDFAITRTDHTNASGHGPVAVMGIVTTDNVAGKMLNPVNTTLQFSLGNVCALTANENPITLDAFGDSIFLDSNLTGLNYLNWDGAIKVYPNPASNYLVVASSLTNISKISILNQLGEIVYNNQKPRLPQNINVAAIPNGVYVLRIETKEGVMHRKIQIIK